MELSFGDGGIGNHEVMNGPTFRGFRGFGANCTSVRSEDPALVRCISAILEHRGHVFVTEPLRASSAASFHRG